MAFTLKAQEIYRNYSTNAYNLAQEKKDGALMYKRAVLEQAIKSSKAVEVTGQLKVTVAIHVIMNNPDEITDEELADQLKRLNEAFNLKKSISPKLVKYAAQWKHKEAVGNISFDLGKSTGKIIILRKVVKESRLEDKAIKSTELGGSSAVDGEKTMNIWIVNLPDNEAGYAQWPGGAVNTDGIVINASYLATKRAKSSKYAQGTTLVHLVGSYLGLYELWGKLDSVCDDDLVTDTPVHNAPNYTAKEALSVSLCTDEHMLLSNYMDNTDDEYQNSFTEGQIRRMRYFLTQKGVRGGLVSDESIQKLIK